MECVCFWNGIELIQLFLLLRTCVCLYGRQDGKLRCVSIAVDGEQLSRARKTLVRLKAFPSSSFLIFFSFLLFEVMKLINE